jgi:serine/threonine protein kinase
MKSVLMIGLQVVDRL